MKTAYHRLATTLRIVIGLVLVSGMAIAQPPAGYYDSIDTGSPTALRLTLHDVIDDHTRYPYTSTVTPGTNDVWGIVNLADEDPNDTGRIVDIYQNVSYAKLLTGGSGSYNREHSWPKSYGFPSNPYPDNNSGSNLNYPYTDGHHLFAADSAYNTARSNKPYRWCHAACQEKTTELTDGRGGGSGFYPGNSSWMEGAYTQGTWETWGGRRGDVARAILYMDVRYEGGTHSITGSPEPDLIVTDDEGLIDSSNTGSNESVGYMGMLAVLIQWHEEDPVDSRELWRNEAVYGFQGNRNPFIDHPEWVDCVFQSTCTFDTTPPSAPSGLVANGGSGVVDLGWSANGETDLRGYNVYRSTTSGSGYIRANAAVVLGTTWADTGVTNGTTYYYVITAVDNSSNESSTSGEASATPIFVPDSNPPAAPSGLAAAAGDASVGLDWTDNAELDIDGYDVYRSTNAGGPYTRLTSPLLATSDFVDATAVNGTTYYYIVTATDTSGNESADSTEVSATPSLVVVAELVLSEVFYDATSTDDGLEWVEIYNSGSTMANLAEYSLGNGGTTYTTSKAQLSGTLAPGATFVVGGPTSASNNFSPVYDLEFNFSPDFQNSGTVGDGVALFHEIASNVTGSTVPIDAVVYGPNNDNNLIDESGSANAPEVGDAPAGSSIERIDLAGSWQIQSSPTPNATPIGAGSNTAPSVTITSPASGTPVITGDTVSFGGTATDAEDGDLTSGLVWTSDLDGQIGTGGSFPTNTLSIGTHAVTASVVDSGGAQGADSVSITVDPEPGGNTWSFAASDHILENGTLGGSYLSTHTSDNVYESLTEELSGGKPSRRHSLADHSWTFDVAAGGSYSFHVEAHHSASTDGDDFRFWFSRDDINYVPMILITKTSDDGAAQSYVFPEDVAGTLYVRVTDTDATRGNQGLDTLFVDAMYVLTSSDGGGVTADSFFVVSIVPSVSGGGKARGRATVTIEDNLGNPVSGAAVTGSFTGSYNETRSGTTDAAGQVTITTSDRVRGTVSFTFCVDTASHSSLAYDGASDLQTCATY